MTPAKIGRRVGEYQAHGLWSREMADRDCAPARAALRLYGLKTLSGMGRSINELTLTGYKHHAEQEPINRIQVKLSTLATPIYLGRLLAHKQVTGQLVNENGPRQSAPLHSGCAEHNPLDLARNTIPQLRELGYSVPLVGKANPTD